MKRAQIEIVGLLMVIVLMAFIILIALWFIAKPRIEYLIPQRQAIEAKSILITLMKTTYAGSGDSFQEKINQCNQHFNIAGSALYRCDEMIREDIRDKILNKILINKKYILEIKEEFQNPFIVISDASGSCNDAYKQKVVGEITINPSPLIKARLIICSVLG